MRLLMKGRAVRRTGYDRTLHIDLDTGQTWTAYSRNTYTDWHPTYVGQGTVGFDRKDVLCEEFTATYAGKVCHRIRNGEVSEIYVQVDHP